MSKKSNAIRDEDPLVDFHDKPTKIKAVEPKFKWTENQVDFIKTALNKETKIVITDGPPGSGKTALAAYCGIRLLHDQDLEQIIYLRSPVESSVSAKIGQLGFLPGAIEQKFEGPYGAVFEDKLKEFLTYPDYLIFKQEKRYKMIPPNFLRGETFKNTVVIVDEANNFDWHLLELIITRLGENSKIFFLGDSNQCDLPKFIKSGFAKLENIFDNLESAENGIHLVKFTNEDIKRSKVLRFIVEKIEQYREKKKTLSFN